MYKYLVFIGALVLSLTNLSQGSTAKVGEIHDINNLCVSPTYYDYFLDLVEVPTSKDPMKYLSFIQADKNVPCVILNDGRVFSVYHTNTLRTVRGDIKGKCRVSELWEVIGISRTGGLKRVFAIHQEECNDGKT